MSLNGHSATLYAVWTKPGTACGTAVGSQCTVGGVTWTRLGDGNVWSGVVGCGNYTSFTNYSCPNNMKKPSKTAFENIISIHGDNLYQLMGWPTHANANYWTTTLVDSNTAYGVDTYGGHIYMNQYSTTVGQCWICYGS